MMKSSYTAAVITVSDKGARENLQAVTGPALREMPDFEATPMTTAGIRTAHLCLEDGPNAKAVFSRGSACFVSFLGNGPSD